MRWLVCILWGLVSACNLFSSATPPETPEEPVRDVGIDAAVDAGADRGADVSPDLSPDQGLERACDSTSDCRGGEDCLRTSVASPMERVCGPVQCGCTPDGWCDQGSRCVKTAPCTDVTDCGGGQVCGEENFCLDTCLASDECGPGFDCTEVLGANYRTCQPATCRCNLPSDYCSADACVHAQLDCASGCPAPQYECDAANDLCECTGDGCRQECFADADCAAFEVCDVANSTCAVDRCREDANCAPGSVCGFVDLLSRVCVRPGSAAAGEPCASAAECAHGFCDDSVCRQPCLGADECPAGDVCNGFSVTYPQCSATSVCEGCTSTQTCMPNIFAGTICLDDCLDVTECAGSDQQCIQLLAGLSFWQFSSCATSAVDPPCPNTTDIWDPFSGACGVACIKDVECEDGEMCWQHVCRKECTSDCECELNETCGEWGSCSAAPRCSDACMPDTVCAGNGKVCDLDAGNCVVP